MKRVFLTPGWVPLSHKKILTQIMPVGMRKVALSEFATCACSRTSYISCLASVKASAMLVSTTAALVAETCISVMLHFHRCGHTAFGAPVLALQ